ncbi:hypothetical protein R6Q59_018232 [Mikania micrantha]
MGKPITMEEEKKGVVGEIINLCSFKNLSNLEVNKNGVDKFGRLLEVEKKGFFRKGEIASKYHNRLHLGHQRPWKDLMVIEQSKTAPLFTVAINLDDLFGKSYRSNTGI